MQKEEDGQEVRNAMPISITHFLLKFASEKTADFYTTDVGINVPFVFFSIYFVLSIVFCIVNDNFYSLEDAP